MTADVILGSFIAVIIISTLTSKGYSTADEKKKMVTQSGIVGGICLAAIYFGLVLIGATYSGQFGPDVDHTALLNAIVHDLLGDFGTWLMSIIALFATITSMIGAVGSVGEFFEDITKKKVPYAWTVGIIALISYILSNGGVEAIL
jgi:LIVCS family branched-chain amino acid:cation transporter